MKIITKFSLLIVIAYLIVASITFAGVYFLTENIVLKLSRKFVQKEVEFEKTQISKIISREIILSKKWLIPLC